MVDVSRAAQIQLTFRDLVAEDEAKQYILEKLSDTIHSVPHLVFAEIEAKFESTGDPDHRYVLKVNLEFKNSLLHVMERGNTLENAVNKARGILDRQVREWKGETYGRRKEQMAAKYAGELEEMVESGGGQLPSLLRIKYHEIKPMFLEDAITRMKAFGHDFYFFLNAEDQQYNVVYRRKMGGYGLIKPQPEA